MRPDLLPLGLALVLTVLNLFLGPPAAALDPGLVVLLLLPLWLETAAVPLPTYGYFSPAVALYVAATAFTGSALPALVAAGGLTLRVVLGDTTRSRETAWEAVSVLAALLPAGLGYRFFSPPITAAITAGVFLAAAQLCLRQPGQPSVEWSRVQRSVVPMRLACAVAGVAMALMPLPWHALLLLPLLMAAARAVRNDIFRIRAEEAEDVLEELDAARGERDLLEGLARHLAASPDLGEAVQAVLATVPRVVRCRSVAILLEEGGRLQVAGSRGAIPDLNGLLPENGRSTGPVHLDFKDETCAVAVPMQELGVLYAARNKKRFSRRETSRLSWIAEKAALSLATARREQARREALASHAQARYQLEERVTLLHRLMVGSRALASTLERGAIIKALREVVEQTLPHDFGLVCFPETGHIESWGEGEPDRKAALIVAGDASRAGSPLRLDGHRLGHDYPSPVGGTRTLLTAPLLSQEGSLGAVLVGSMDPDAYGQEHADLLLVLACQAAAALSNASRYWAVVRAREELENKQAQLVQSGKMMAVGQMVAGIAHELNTPLGAVSLSLEAAEMQLENRPQEAARKLEVAQKAVEKAQSLIDRLLVYSRKAEVENEKVSLAAVAMEALALSGHRLRGQNLHVRTDFKVAPSVMGKPQELQQVVINLLLNAADASPEESQITVRTDRRGDCALLEVIDLGHGIAPEHLDRLFEPFFTTKPPGRGTGLGLAISHEIVQQHGGTIEVESTPGAGSVFRLVLPVS